MFVIKFKGFDEGRGVSAVSSTSTFQLELRLYLMMKIREFSLSDTG
jgi:hypothetical protein